MANHQPLSTDTLSSKLAQYYGIKGTLTHLAGYEDQNYLLELPNGHKRLLKIGGPSTDLALLRAQQRLIEQASLSTAGSLFPHLITTKEGNAQLEIQEHGRSYHIYVLSYLEGKVIANQEHSLDLMKEIGKTLGILDQAIADLPLLALRARVFEWDLCRALEGRKYLTHIKSPEKRRLVHYFLQQFGLRCIPAFSKLRWGNIHGDANDYNILCKDGKLSGILDFGDSIYNPMINEVAIALAYCLMDKSDPLPFAHALIEAYHQQFKLEEEELEILYYLVAARLSFSLAKSAHAASLDPENDYWQISDRPAWDLLRKWHEINPEKALNTFRNAAAYDTISSSDHHSFLQERHKHISQSLSISYQRPIKMQSAAMQYMYGDDGVSYLDCVNNICHIGHCHPRVVEAIQRQAATLNTNTRYLYDGLNEYAEALTARFPDPLEVVFFTNSGSEAGDLAQRIARTVTRQRDTLVIDHAYHGNTLAGIEVSPYKFKGKGGQAQADHIHILSSPDSYQGSFTDFHTAGPLYAREAQALIAQLKEEGKGIAAFYAESILGCGGQVVLPPRYLQEVYQYVHAAGGLTIADEVQVGFGRIGSHFWGFESQGVVPDIVVLGKPMGNGHPLAGVVTSRAIAERFNNGMEYFNSFGGNPVSCAIGLEVLKTIEEEELQAHALKTGNYLMDGFKELQHRFSCIGDVRGLGLFIGIELVKDPESREPYPVLAKALVNQMRDEGILLSTDGPYNNVIKIKPPLVFHQENAELIIERVQAYLTRHI